MMIGFFWIGCLALVLFVGGVVADYVLPRIPAVERFLDSFGTEWEDDDEQ